MDDPSSPNRMAGVDVDYIAADFLAEASLPSLVTDQMDDDSLGYSPHFLPAFEDSLDEILDRGIKIITNAGGLNPDGLVHELLDVIDDRTLRIAAVTGDDILESVDTHREQGVSFDNIDTGKSFTSIEDNLVSANVYLGAFPTAKALDRGADIVITGRAVDPAAAMGPMIHEFEWNPTDYDRLAAGLVAGHIAECGAQSTGGRFMLGWRGEDSRNWGYPVDDYHNWGYPVLEVEENGDFVVTKPEDTGGIVTEQTITQQLLYEIKDPIQYHSPDVTADFTTPRIEEVGSDRVSVTGVEANGRPEMLKVVMIYRDGYKAESTKLYTWPNAIEKARWEETALRKQASDRIDTVRTEFIGWNACHEGLTPEPDGPPEIGLRIALKDDDPEVLGEFVRASTSGLRGPPTSTPLGTSGPTEVLSFWPASIPREKIDLAVTVYSKESGGIW